MRIIAGQRRGHKFDGPKGKSTRPTSEMVREAIFNILGPLITGRVVVDLFAGTGALGFEALSRGAARAIFVEQNRENVGLIHRNSATLRFEDRVRILNADAYRWVRGYAPVDDAPLVVFLDPPYREYDERPVKVGRMLETLIRRLPHGSVVAVESRRTLDEGVLPELEKGDIRRYGGTRIAIRVVNPEEGSAGAPTRSEAEPGGEIEFEGEADAER